jgi:hypothetical protein
MVLSLISFDLANETLLKKAITAVDSKVKVVSVLENMIELADNVFAKAPPLIPPVPDAEKVRRVRRIRNGAMHEAKYPTAADINDCRTYTRDFLEQLTGNVWGVSFDSISLTDVIKHPYIKNQLIKAEAEVKRGDINRAVGRCTEVFTRTIAKTKHSVAGDFTDISSTHKIDEYVVAGFKKMSNTVFLSMVGLAYPSYLRFKDISSAVSFTEYKAGNEDLLVFKDTLTLEDAEYVLNYVVNAVIQIESLVGDIEKPFGI